MTMKRLLFLSGGSQVAQFVLAALRQRRSPLRLLATSSISDDPGLWEYDKVFLVPPTAKQPAEFKERVLRIIAEEKVDLVIPCRDDDIAVLGELAEAHPELWPKAMCGPSRVGRAMDDKWNTYLFCKQHNLPVAESLIAGSAETPQQFAERVGFPLIAKPRDGFSSKGIFLLENLAQLERALARPKYAVQEFLGDPETYWSFKRSIELDGMPLFYTLHGLKHEIQLMFTPSSEHVGTFATFNRQAFRARHVDPNTEAETLALARRCGEVFSRLGWRGPLNIQCQRDRRGRLTIHEFNGRYSALAAERWMLGYDEVAMGIELFTDLKLAESSWATRPARHVVAQLASCGSDPAKVDALEKHRAWTRDDGV
jgi:carbamoyl-phosphate synthase large subunit